MPFSVYFFFFYKKGTVIYFYHFVEVWKPFNIPSLIIIIVIRIYIDSRSGNLLPIIESIALPFILECWTIPIIFEALLSTIFYEIINDFILILWLGRWNIWRIYGFYQPD